MEKNSETEYTKGEARLDTKLCSDTVTPRQDQHVYYILLKVKEEVGVFFSGLETCWQQ